MSKKILLADDSLTIQKVISITLASEDYDLEIVGDGNAAIAKAKTFQPDLILADVAMPGKNGYEVCEIIKKDPALARIPVLLLAGTFEPLNREEAGRVKADDSIIKPFESSSFVEKVKLLLSKAEDEAAPKEVEVTELPEAKPELTGNVWDAGDFLGAPEPEEAEAEAGEGDDMDFLGGGLFDEAVKEADEETPDQVTPDQAFMDLDLNAAPKAAAPKAATPPAPPRVAAPAPRPVAPPRAAAPPPPPPPEIDFNAFSTEPVGAVPQEEDASSFWTQGDAVAPSAPPPPPPPLRKPHPPAAAPPAPAPPPRPAAPPPVERAPVERAVEKTAVAAAERMKDAPGLSAAVTSALSREEITELIRQTAREIIEEIAWEVVPELTEEIVSNEMLKFRESFLKTKERKA